MKSLLVVASLLAFAAVAGAQSGGPYAPIVLLEPAGARTLGMGNVGVAGRDDDVLFYNPAQLAIARGMSISGERYSANAGGGTISAVTKLGPGAIAIGAQTVDYRSPTGAVVVAPGIGPAVLATFPADRATSRIGGETVGSSSELTAGYGMTLKGFRLGGAAKYAVDELAATRIESAAFDVGVSKDWMRYFSAALAVQNIGATSHVPCVALGGADGSCDVNATPGAPSPIRFPVDLPLRTTLGIAASGPAGPLDLTATAAASMYRSNWLSPAAGVEASYSWLDGYDVALRAGARRPLAGEGTLTAGAGFTADRLSIDYALETFTGRRVGHRFGLRIR